MTNKDKDQVLIPMVTTIEAALDYGYSMKDIRLWRIGNRMCTVILVPGTKEQYDSYLSSFSKEFKAEDRDKRCQIRAFSAADTIFLCGELIGVLQVRVAGSLSDHGTCH